MIEFEVKASTGSGVETKLVRRNIEPRVSNVINPPTPPHASDIIYLQAINTSNQAQVLSKSALALPNMILTCNRRRRRVRSK